MILHVGAIILANALLAALGSGVLMLIDAWRRLGWWARAAVTVLAGQAAFAAGAPLLLYARLSVSPFIVVPVIALVVAAGVVVERRRNRPAEPRPCGGGWVGAAFVSAPLLVLAIRAALHPLFQFDTISNWVLKATVIWAGGDRVTGVLDPRLFTRPDLHPQSHLEYPLGMNALYAWDLQWLGTVDTRVIHLQAVVILAAAVGTAWVLLRPIVPAWPLAAGLAGLVMMPTLIDSVLSAYADVPLACLWAIGTIALMRWTAEGESYLLRLATLLLAGALAVKQDGVFYDVAAYVAVGIPLLLHSRGRLRALGASAGIVALSAVPWRVYSAWHHLGQTDIRPGIERMESQTGNLRPTADGLVHVLTSRATLLAVPIAVAFAIVCLRRRRRAEAAPFLIAAGLVPAAVLMIYWNAAVDLRLVLISALSRILLGLIILAWLLLPALVLGAIGSPPPPRPLDRAG